MTTGRMISTLQRAALTPHSDSAAEIHSPPSTHHASRAAGVREFIRSVRAASTATADGSLELFETIPGFGHPLPLKQHQAPSLIQLALTNGFLLGQESNKRT